MNLIAPFLFSLLACAASAMADTIVLRQGLDGYSGCRDATIYQDDSKSRSYSRFRNREMGTGSPGDASLVTTRFAC